MKPDKRPALDVLEDRIRDARKELAANVKAAEKARADLLEWEDCVAASTAEIADLQHAINQLETLDGGAD